jgi:uncharacterized protein (TIRG00374 family)
MHERGKQVLKFLRILLSAIAIPLVAYVVIRNWDTFTMVFRTPVDATLAIIGVSVLAMAANSLRMQTTCMLFDVRPTFVESFRVAAANSFYNIITPVKSGLAIKGMYLKTVHGMPWTDYFASLGVTQVIASIVSVTVALVILMAFDAADLGVVLAVAGLLALAVLLVMAFRDRIQSVFAGTRILGQLPSALASAGSRQGLIALFVVVHLLYLLMITARLYLVFLIFVPDVEFWQILLIQAVLTGTMFVSITPGNIGIQEGLVAVASAYLQIDPSIAVLASLSERAFLLVTALPIGGLCSVSVMRQLAANDCLRA